MQWRKGLLPGAIFALALALRVWFIVAGQIEHPARGDALQYLRYAVNLVQWQVYSSAGPGAPLVPDSFRDPGYPFFLAALLLPLGLSAVWYVTVLMAQAALGALTASLTFFIARRSLPTGAAVLAGTAVAVWPHNVVISGYMLSETLFGFAVALAVWQACRALESASRGSWLITGLAFGLAATVNATLTPFVLLLALPLWRRGMLTPSMAALLVAGSLLLPGAWAVRGMYLDQSRSPGARASMNFVQGSWPEYHDAYAASFQQNSAAKEAMQAIAAEQELMQRSPAQGLAAMTERMKAEPLHYLAWYAWKPALLWAWSIRMGWGDIYPYPVKGSIYLSNPVMPAVEAVCYGLNPMLLALMASAVVVLLCRRGLAGSFPALFIVALLAAFETLVYTVLQSEPRYSIPFRPMEMILAVSAVWGLLHLRRGKALPAARQPLPGPLTPAGCGGSRAGKTPAIRGDI